LFCRRRRPIIAGMQRSGHMSRGVFTGVAVAAFLSLAATGPASASFDNAFAAYLGGNYAAALPMARRAAESDNPAAQWLLGTMLLLGKGAPEDAAGARLWLGRAAEANYPPAQAVLGRMLEQGLGGEADAVAAGKLYRAAAEQGFADAAYLLGRLYLAGKGVAASNEEAEHWLGQAVAAGNRDAMYLMSRLLTGDGALPTDTARATSLLVQAAHAGHMLAQLELGRHYATSVPVIAARWFLRAAEQGEPAAQTAYGEALAAGRGVDPDPAGAREWLARAAAQGHAPGQAVLAAMLAEGTGGPADPVEALKWAQLAAEGAVAAARPLFARLTKTLDAAQRAEAASRARAFVAVPEPPPGERP